MVKLWIFQWTIFLTALYVLTARSIDSCRINDKNDITDNNWVFTKPNQNGDLELLLADSVSIGEKLILICSSNASIVINCLRTGKFSIDFKMVSKCQTPHSIIISEAKDECTPGTKYTSVGYNVVHENRKFDLELYRVCYNSKNFQTLYSEHRLKDRRISKIWCIPN